MHIFLVFFVEIRGADISCCATPAWAYEYLPVSHCSRLRKCNTLAGITVNASSAEGVSVSTNPFLNRFSMRKRVFLKIVFQNCGHACDQKPIALVLVDFASPKIGGSRRNRFPFQIGRFCFAKRWEYQNSFYLLSLNKFWINIFSE